MPQNVKSFGVGSHQSVFNPVMNHLNEMAGAGRPAMEITLLDRARYFFPSRGTREIAASRSERLEDWIELQYGIALTSDHQTITALDPPHAAARPHIDVANTFGLQFFGSPDIINIVRVASINDGAPCCIWPVRSCTVTSTAAAGTINQTARGGFSLAMKSSSEAAPVAPLFAKSLTLSGLLSKTTHSWPPCNRRLTILAPILPRPIIPSCIFAILPSIKIPRGLVEDARRCFPNDAPVHLLRISISSF